jgi:hypothetical protein
VNLPMMIVFRALQGFTGGILIPDGFDKRRRFQDEAGRRC